MKKVQLTIEAVTPENAGDKLEAAITTLEKALGVNRGASEPSGGESWVFQSQADFSDQLCSLVSTATEEILTVFAGALDLPSVRTIQKSETPLSWRGKIIFHPETGAPIKKSDFDKLIGALERFLNRRLADADKKIVLGSRTLAKLLNAMVKRQGSPEAAIRGLHLEDVVKRERGWGALTTSLGNWAQRYKVSSREADQVYLAIQTASERVTGFKSGAIRQVKLSLLEGIQQRKPRAAIAQDLFDKIGAMNRDWRRIVETETADNFNNAWLRMESAKVPAGQKVYFKRVEMFDDHVCKFCEGIRDKIVLWSEAPLQSDKIRDEWTDTAIWEGKSNIGRRKPWLAAGPQHPHCRGSWVRWEPPAAKDDPIQEKISAMEVRLAEKAEKRKEVRAAMLAEGWKDTDDNWTEEFKRRVREGT